MLQDLALLALLAVCGLFLIMVGVSGLLFYFDMLKSLLRILGILPAKRQERGSTERDRSSEHDWRYDEWNNGDDFDDGDI